MTQTNTHDPTATDRDERRWDRWGRLTLVIGVLLVVWPVFLALVAFRYPTDGWSSSSTEGFEIGGTYKIGDRLLDEATPLQKDDNVVAIDGRPLLPNIPPPFPDDLAVGQVIRYTLNRPGRRSRPMWHSCASRR